MFAQSLFSLGDAHESSILAEALGLASIGLPRNGLATLERASTVLDYTRPTHPNCLLVPPFSTPRHSTPLEATRHHSREGVMNPAGPSPCGLRLSIEVDRASWIATVLLVLGWLLAYR
jgi:hypothetical protein